MSWFFILGAGASADSGLPTYRGPDGIYVNMFEMTTQENFNKIKLAVDAVEKPGPTYDKIKEVAPKGSFVLTQNIDGFVRTLGLDYVEIHMKGDELVYENIVQMGESLPRLKMHDTYKMIKKRKPPYVVIIGTSMMFPYLREYIHKGKAMGAKVIHINPASDYIVNVPWNEKWIRAGAVEGLDYLVEHVDDEDFWKLTYVDRVKGVKYVDLISD